MKRTLLPPSASLLPSRHPKDGAASHSAGRGLDAETRASFESRLGEDFSRVRIHADAPAAAAAAHLGAKAFAVGDDVGFAEGREETTTSAGRELLAHELTHVAQQRRGGAANTGAEPQAQAAAERVAEGDAVSAQAQGGAGAGVQCDPDDEKKAAAGSSGPLAPLASPSLFPTGGTQFPLIPPLSLGPLLGPSESSIDWRGIAEPYASHTAPMVPADQTVAGWMTLYRMYQGGWGLSPGSATSAANFSMPLYVGSHLERESPNTIERSNLDFKAAYPDAKGIPPLPVISPGTLGMFYKLVTGKEKDFHF